MAESLQCETCGWIGEHTEAQCIDRWGDMFKLIIRAFGPEKVAEMYADVRVLAGKEAGDGANAHSADSVRRSRR